MTEGRPAEAANHCSEQDAPARDPLLSPPPPWVSRHTLSPTDKPSVLTAMCLLGWGDKPSRHLSPDKRWVARLQLQDLRWLNKFSSHSVCPPAPALPCDQRLKGGQRVAGRLRSGGRFCHMPPRGGPGRLQLEEAPTCRHVPAQVEEAACHMVPGGGYHPGAQVEVATWMTSRVVGSRSTP